MTVRCKFKCNEIIARSQTRSEKNADGSYRTWHEPVYSVVMTPVYSSDPNSENKQFWDASPTGRFEVGTIKQLPWELNGEYYIDITPVETK